MIDLRIRFAAFKHVLAFQVTQTQIDGTDRIQTAFQPKLSAFRSSLPGFAFVHSFHLTFLADEICYEYDKGLDLAVFSTHSGLTDLK
jgi:hypothetical protein